MKLTGCWARTHETANRATRIDLILTLSAHGSQLGRLIRTSADKCRTFSSVAQWCWCQWRSAYWGTRLMFCRTQTIPKWQSRNIALSGIDANRACHNPRGCIHRGNYQFIGLPEILPGHERYVGTTTITHALSRLSEGYSSAAPHISSVELCFDSTESVGWSPFSQFYRLKARDDMESIKSTKPLSLQRKKYKRVSNVRENVCHHSSELFTPVSGAWKND